MAWILKSLFIIVMTTSATKCKNNYGHTLSEDFPQYQYDYAEYNPLFQRPNYQSYQNNYPRMIGRSAERTSESTNVRANERSYSAHSGTQRAQEQERRRIESRIAEPVTRIENGSYKILNYPNLSNRRGGSDASSVKDRIVFPGPTSAKYQIPDVPEECKRIGICSDVPNYPTQLVERALAKLGDMTGKFTIDELDVLETPDIAQRIGPPEKRIELCYYKEQVHFPKGAVDKHGNFLYIVNNDDQPLQGVKVEICDTERNLSENNGSCNKIATFPPSSSSECHQKYVTRKLWALENNKVVEKPVPIPSCCSCFVSSN